MFIETHVSDYGARLCGFVIRDEVLITLQLPIYLIDLTLKIDLKSAIVSALS